MITKPILAAKPKKEKNDLDKIKYPILCTPKLDGIRAIKVDGKLLSRTFKPIPNKFIRNELEKLLPDGFDGEIMLRDCFVFQKITSAVMSRDGEPDYVYWAFDWVSESLDIPYHKRVREMLSLEHLAKTDRVKFLKPVLVKSREELDDYEKKCLDKGFEGCMTRDPNGKYKCGRATMNSQELIAVKRFIDSEALVIGFEERLKNTNEQKKNELGYAKRSSAKDGMVAAGTLGKFLVRDIYTEKEFAIGGGPGLNDELRLEIWKNQKKYLGQYVVYKFQEYGVKEETGIPRLPQWKGFRHKDDIGKLGKLEE